MPETSSKPNGLPSRKTSAFRGPASRFSSKTGKSEGSPKTFGKPEGSPGAIGKPLGSPDASKKNGEPTRTQSLKTRGISRKALLFSILILLSLLLILSGKLDRVKVWEDMPYNLLKFEQGRAARLSEGAAYGAMNSGPGLNLPAGTYRLKWRTEGDGENALRISGKYGINADTERIVLPAGESEGEAAFTLYEACAGLQLTFEFSSGTEFTVNDLRLYSPRYHDGACLLIVLLILFLGGYALRGRLDGEARSYAVLLTLAVLIASAPALKDTVGIGHDTTFHLIRLMNLADGLKNAFPVRLGAFSYNGFGAVTSVFYPDLFLTFPALLIDLGCSLTFSVNLFLVLVNAASAAAMFYAARRVFGRDAAACSAILYTLAIYRISDVYTRFGLGEMTAMVFLPLFLLGLYECLLGDAGRWRLLGFSAAAICLSHVLSTVLCALLAVCCCLFCLGRIFRERRFLPLLKAALAALLLCAFWLVPFLYFSRQGLGASSLMKDPAQFALHPAQLFLLGEGELAVDPEDAGLSTFALEIGLPLLLASALALCMRAPEKEKRLALALVLLGAAFALGATTLFPWSYLRKLTGGLSDYLQFPWRLLMLTCVLLAAAGGCGAFRFSRGNGEMAAAALLALAAVCALPTLSREARTNSRLSFGEIAGPDLSYTEYTLPGTKPKETRDGAPVYPESLTMTDYAKRGSTVEARVSAKEDAVLSLPLYGYEGYSASVDGKKLDVSCGTDRRLEVGIPAGTEGKLTVRYTGVPFFAVSDLISLIGCILLIVSGVWGFRKKQ